MGLLSKRTMFGLKTMPLEMLIGGQLWSSLAVALDEFRQGTFRLMLKAKFDKSADGKVTRGVYVIGIYTSRVLVSSTTLCSKKRDF